jgi:hypothetical protein
MLLTTSWYLMVNLKLEWKLKPSQHLDLQFVKPYSTMSIKPRSSSLRCPSEFFFRIQLLFSLPSFSFGLLQYHSRRTKQIRSLAQVFRRIVCVLFANICTLHLCLLKSQDQMWKINDHLTLWRKLIAPLSLCYADENAQL